MHNATLQVYNTILRCNKGIIIREQLNSVPINYKILVNFLNFRNDKFTNTLLCDTSILVHCVHYIFILFQKTKLLSYSGADLKSVIVNILTKLFTKNVAAKITLTSTSYFKRPTLQVTNNINLQNKNIYKLIIGGYLFLDIVSTSYYDINLMIRYCYTQSNLVNSNFLAGPLYFQLPKSDYNINSYTLTSWCHVKFLVYFSNCHFLISII